MTGDCVTCGHPVDHHDAGECWTTADGHEIRYDAPDNCNCDCLKVPDDATVVSSHSEPGPSAGKGSVLDVIMDAITELVDG